MNRDGTPDWNDWIRAVPADRRDLFARHFNARREIMLDAWGSGANIEGRGTCPCLRCTEKQPAPRAERMWEGQ